MEKKNGNTLSTAMSTEIDLASTVGRPGPSKVS